MRTDRIGRYAFGSAAVLVLAVVAVRYGASRQADTVTVSTAPGDRTDVGAVVAAHPDDPHAWILAGERDFALGHYPEAARSYARATALDPRRAASWSALGEALTLAGHAVTDDALQAFRRALVEDPDDARARYFIGVRQDLMGDHVGAVETWSRVLKTSPADAPWAGSIRELILTVGRRYGIADAAKLAAEPAEPSSMSGASIAAAAIPGPSTEQMAAAARLTPTEQNEMAQAMVAKLAARLKMQPRDAAGWVRLIRAYSVLGDRNRARQAMVDARQIFANDEQIQAKLANAAEILHL